MNQNPINIDANQMINILSNRFAQKSAALESEVALLIAENQVLKQENEKLKAKKEESKSNAK